MDAFPLEVVRRWKKWLRSLPEFSNRHTDGEIQRLILRDENDCSSDWRAFNDFVGEFLKLNPSVKEEFEPFKRQVDRWLESA